MKMCNISVEPIPSRISIPNCRFQALKISAGKLVSKSSTGSVLLKCCTFSFPASPENASRAVAFSGDAGNENVQHFSRTDPVKDFDTKLPLPGVENFSRQCFPGRNAFSYRREIHAAARTFSFPQHRGIESRHGEKN